MTAGIAVQCTRPSLPVPARWGRVAGRALLGALVGQLIQPDRALSDRAGQHGSKGQGLPPGMVSPDPQSLDPVP